MIRQNQSRHVAFARFDMPYRPIPAGEKCDLAHDLRDNPHPRP
jgi:hypothetical protein